ncbi:Clp protease N-terminal domain-containing protein [Cryptosporangium sp. NPDC048952]|uniref:Clp protease N-terminal domain-containing protein n=1 Tax=Cryptosporangium sp. NPDC048952 TaxID=3363961 RepID=UPI0037246763
MTDELTVDDRLTRTLARARGLTAGPVGTDHLLYAVAHDEHAGALLDTFDVTPIVVVTVVKTAGRVTNEPVDPAPTDSPTVRTADGRPLPVSATAEAALRSVADSQAAVRSAGDGSRAAVRSVADDSRVALLAALLEDPASEACGVLRSAGVDVDAVRAAARAGHAERGEDRVPPELRPARDALLGRVRYRGRGLKDKLLFSVFAREVNHAAHPVMWIRAEADERARRQKRATRTDDLLLALLVTHEVAAGYPHMAAGAADGEAPAAGRYGGGDTLLARGIDHRRVRAVTLDDRPDEVPADKILKPGPDWPEDTGVLLERLTAHPGNRSARILAALA